MKKYVKIISLCLVAVLISSFFIGCTKQANGKQSLSAESTQSDGTAIENLNKLYYVALRINPEIELVVQNNVVTGVNAINEDGEIVMSEADLRTLNVEDACEKFTETSIELGYLDADNEDATVNVEVSGEDSEQAEQVKEKIKTRVKKFFKDHGVCGKVQDEDFEKDSQLEALAKEWNVGLHDAKVVSRILELYPEMTAEDVLALSVKERLELLRDNEQKNNLVVDAKNQCNAEVQKIKAKYKEMFDLKDEIKELRKKLRTEELTDEVKEALTKEIEEKTEKYDDLFEQYLNEIRAIRQGFIKDTEEKREEIKKKAQEKKGEFKEKWEKHLEKFEKENPPTEAIQPTIPSKVSDLTRPSRTNGYVEPTRASKPTGITKTTRASKPVDVTKPTCQSKPTGITKTTRASKPVDVTKPTRASQPVFPTKPGKITAPIEICTTNK